MAYSTEEFLNKIKPMVIEDMRKTGILASLTASQALIESNKGNSGLTQKANNLFGMKGAYNGQSVTMPTTEYYNGVKTTVNAAFRKYPSWAESIADHSGLFNRSSRYANLRGLTDYKLACKYVKDDGYATRARARRISFIPKNGSRGVYAFCCHPRPCSRCRTEPRCGS